MRQAGVQAGAHAERTRKMRPPLHAKFAVRLDPPAVSGNTLNSNKGQ